jgi:dGTPase
MAVPPRAERQYGPAKLQVRTDAQRDRDRVLYCSAFRRLAGVTQVVAPIEGHVFHNRLTHTLETAQIARRIAEKFLVLQGELAQEWGGIDPDVVEAAALIHDLGHPPFGHAAETELCRLADEQGDGQGFEGNAQSFRIVTRLAAHRPEYPGLNLTRGTLNASLKYPWLRDRKHSDPRRRKKYGAYDSDRASFLWVRSTDRTELPSVEAQIMTYADDVAYSVHDLDDFVRAGLIPIARLKHDRDAFDQFIRAWKDAPAEERRVHPDTIESFK